MSLWIVDGGIDLVLPVVARVDDWQENDHIDVTGADENGEWLPEPVRYVKERGTCKPATYHGEEWWSRVDPGEHYEFWEPACACSECGELIPMRKFCSNCGRRIEVDE